MKKLLSIVASAALVLGLVSCGSTGGASKKSAAPGYEHPMTYTLDLADSGSPETISFADNSQYGDKGISTRQVVVDFTKVVKINKPQVGDKVTITGKIVSPVDLDKVLIGLIDDSPAANYWTVLSKSGDDENVYLEGIKANEPYEINYTFDVKVKMSGAFKVQLAYGEQNGGTTAFKVERVGPTDIGTPTGDVVDPQHKVPKTWEFDISKDAAYLEMAPEYPWVDGHQDTMADPLLYSGRIDITKLFGEDLPIAGDKLHLTWKTKCNADISELFVRAVENTAAVPGWWKELDKKYIEETVGNTIGTGIKAGEVNNFTFDIELAEGIIQGLTLYIWYPLEAGESSLFTYVRD